MIDDGSSDDTAEQAREAGARVVAGPGGAGGKGQAMAAALGASAGEIVVFLDADVANTTPAFVTGLLGPLLTTDDVALVKGFYTRPLHGEPTGGGRVTELMARPVLELLFPELSDVRQPLAGETAAHRWVFEKVGFAEGYGVELGLLIDVAQELGRGPPGPGRPRRADPPQPPAARAAAPGRRRAPRRARARTAPSSLPRRRERRERHDRRLQPGAVDVPRRATTASSSRSRPAGAWRPRCTASRRAPARHGPR